MACDRRGTQIRNQHDADSPSSRSATFPTHHFTPQHSTGRELNAQRIPLLRIPNGANPRLFPGAQFDLSAIGVAFRNKKCQQSICRNTRCQVRLTMGWST